MPLFTDNGVTVHYEEYGSGYPVLLIASGALNSTVDRWPSVRINPLELYPDQFRFIAIDTRNAGQSSGPFPIADPWGDYTRDQLHLLDYLGIDHFQMLGCCIGCSYALKMAELAPDRLDAAVLQSPIGLSEANHERWTSGWREFVAKLVSKRQDLTQPDGEAWGNAMWEQDDFVFSVNREFVAKCPTPLLVLPGDSANHPHETSMEIVSLAPNVACVEPWEEPESAWQDAVAKTRGFMLSHRTEL